ncbi:ABC transporter permease [Paenibacillus swuensis]|uniref:ABC transporter permease n=1 Tax=Paenibacillus swuensis TaxID=1178515 RepID=A0A172TN44_9BACL|nr:carbohydrate ABC transporter permease [Paenibacillus swuensis]ANE48247.1 ABC transporter permease [Paenibacillus swuensis]
MVTSRTFSDKFTDFLLYTLLIIISFTAIAPLVHSVAVSFSQPSFASAGFVTFWPKGFTVASYIGILEDSKFWTAFIVSLKRVVLVSVISLIVTLLAAYPLSRETRDFKLRNVYMWLLLIVMMFNGGLIPLYLVVKNLNLIDSIWGLVLPMVVNVFNVILVVNFFRNLPKELDESASIDGAGPWYMISRIYAPLSLPVLATITLFTIVYTWNEFFQGMIFVNRPDNMPLQSYLQQLIVQIDPTRVTSEDLDRLQRVSNKTLNSAKIIVSMIPVLLIYPLMQRYFITGITMGSVKE